MTYETKISKTLRGDWKAETQADLGAVAASAVCNGGQRIVRLTTIKGNRGQISSRAACYTVSDWSETHAFGLGAGGDYSKQVATIAGRGTEKAIATAHAAALEQFAAIIEEARQWYATGKDRHAA